MKTLDYGAIQPGMLRHRVDIETPHDPPTRTGSGAIEKLWDLFQARVHVSIEPLGGEEIYSGGAFNTMGTHRIRMRYIAGLTTKMRIVYGTRTFDIIDIGDTDERRRELVLTCKEGKTKGN